jgi:hypothetical protein
MRMFASFRIPKTSIRVGGLLGPGRRSPAAAWFWICFFGTLYAIWWWASRGTSGH